MPSDLTVAAGRTRSTTSRRAETGVALVVGLVFLIVMSLISIEVSRSSLRNQRLATNGAVKQHAFERAENARDTAERLLPALATAIDDGGAFDCVVLGSGFFALSGVAPGCPTLDAHSLLWNDNDSNAPLLTDGERFVIEYLGTDAVLLPGTGFEIGTGESEAVSVHLFRVVARGSEQGSAATTIETRFAVPES